MGESAKLHIASLLKMRVKIVGVVDLNIEKAKEKARQWGITRCYNSLEALFNQEDVDVVHICTPPQSHYPLILEALQRNCHVICEKPILLSCRDMTHVLKLASEKNLRVFQVENFKFHPSIRKGRQLVNTATGNVKYAYVFWPIPVYLKGNIPQWMKQLPGQQFTEVAMHPIYIIIDFIGSEIQKIDVSQQRNALGQPDTLTILIKTNSAIGIVTISKSCASPGMLIVHGEKLSFSANIDNNSLIIFGRTDNLYSKFMVNIVASTQLLSSSLSNAIRYLAGSFKEGYHYDFIRSVYEAILGKQQGPTSHEHIYASVKVYEEVLNQLSYVH